ncbi:hypothetical protein GCM10029963_09310 [Micromonospora andamanensis]
MLQGAGEEAAAGDGQRLAVLVEAVGGGVQGAGVGKYSPGMDRQPSSSSCSSVDNSTVGLTMWPRCPSAL